MTQLEHLAIGYAEREYPEDMEDDRGIAYLAYKAGFRKAQQMAKDIVFREINDHTPTAAIIFIGQMADAPIAERVEVKENESP